jgi:hypothetical protein
MVIVRADGNCAPHRVYTDAAGLTKTVARTVTIPRRNPTA